MDGLSSRTYPELVAVSLRPCVASSPVVVDDRDLFLITHTHTHTSYCYYYTDYLSTSHNVKSRMVKTESISQKKKDVSSLSCGHSLAINHRPKTTSWCSASRYFIPVSQSLIRNQAIIVVGRTTHLPRASPEAIDRWPAK
ncbi:hypothetical protein CBL_05417 [Carabus blaptoides fortunei]